MKLFYNQETKRVPDCDKIQDLYQLVTDTFQINGSVKLGSDLKLYYHDEDGDTITVTTQSDLNEAKKAMHNRGGLKLIVAATNSQADFEIESRHQRSQRHSGIQERLFNEDFVNSFHDLPMTERNAPVSQLQYPDLDKPMMEQSRLSEPKPEVARKKPSEEPKVDNEKMVADFKALLSKEVSKYCKTHMKKLYNMHLQKKKQQQAQVVHHVACNECGVSQITGIRYKCTQRDNYNICEHCEAKLGADSQFSFIKIRRPGTEPVKLICMYNRVPQTQTQAMELRHAPVAPKKESFVDKLENDDLKESTLSFGEIPLVHPPTETNLNVSELTKSTMGKIQFVD